MLPGTAASMVLNSNVIMDQNRKVDVDVAAAVAVAAANKGIAPSITQSFPPGSTIQLIPVSMAAQIGGVQRNWANQLQLPQLAHHAEQHHQRTTQGGQDQKSPIDARQSIVGVSSAHSRPSSLTSSQQDLEGVVHYGSLFSQAGGDQSSGHSQMHITPQMLETIIRLKHDKAEISMNSYDSQGGARGRNVGTH